MISFEGFFSLKREKVCRMVAESILKAARKFNLSDFLPVWQESVIPGRYLNIKIVDLLTIVN